MRRPASFAQPCCLAGAVTLALALGSRAARADARALEQLIHIDAGDRCPSAAEIAAETWQLTPPHQRGVLGELIDVTVEHRAGVYRVIVSTKNSSTARAFSESEPDCRRRARFAAVFIVLLLIPADDPAPPELPPPVAAPPRPVAEPQKPAPPARPAAPERALVRLELSGTLERAVPGRATPGILSFAGRLQALIGRGPIAPSVGLSYSPPAPFELDATRATLSRAGVALGIRARAEVGACELGLDVAATFELERVAGKSPLTQGTDAATQLGGRAAAMLAWPATAAVQPFVTASAHWFPEPHALVVLPRGTVGTLPRLWVGASVGIALAL